MKKRLTHNLGLKLVSLALAFVLWYLVIQIIDPTDSMRFSNVQVKLVNTELLEQLGKVYEVLDGTDTVSVKVYAPGSVLSQIRDTDIVAEADVSKLTEINTIPINYYVENATVERIESNDNVVRLNVEEKSSKWIRLVGNTAGEVAEGHMIYSTSLDQTNIEITGPKSAVSQVEYAAVELSVAGATNNLSANIDIELFGEDNKKLSQDNITKNVKTAYMTVEVLDTKEVPIQVQYSGVPEEGYLPTGVVESDITTVVLAGRTSVLDNISAVIVPEDRLSIEGAVGNVEGIINIKDYLPDNVKFADKTFNGKITVTVLVEPIVSEEIEIPVENIAFINLPKNYEAEWPEDVENYSLTIFGLWEYINSVQEETITGYIDVAAFMRDANMEELIQGVHIVPVKFMLPENVASDEQLNASIRFYIPDEDTYAGNAVGSGGCICTYKGKGT